MVHRQYGQTCERSAKDCRYNMTPPLPYAKAVLKASNEIRTTFTERADCRSLPYLSCMNFVTSNALRQCPPISAAACRSLTVYPSWNKHLYQSANNLRSVCTIWPPDLAFTAA